MDHTSHMSMSGHGSMMHDMNMHHASAAAAGGGASTHMHGGGAAAGAAGGGMQHEHMMMHGGGGMAMDHDMNMMMPMYFVWGTSGKVLFSWCDISSRFSYFFFCIFLMFLCFMRELLQHYRLNVEKTKLKQRALRLQGASANHHVSSSNSFFQVDEIISTLLYAINMALGYMIMLVIMTYDVYLFLVIIISSALSFYYFRLREKSAEEEITRRKALLDDDDDDLNFTNTAAGAKNGVSGTKHEPADDYERVRILGGNTISSTSSAASTGKRIGVGTHDSQLSLAAEREARLQMNVTQDCCEA